MKKDQLIQKTELTLDRIEGDQAILMTEDDEEVVLPERMLPRAVKEGDVLVLTIAASEADTKQREQTAKDLLNELLN